MKQILSLILTVLLLTGLLGCDSSAIDPVSFYYCREPESFVYFKEDSVVCVEPRDLTGHQEDLRYMIGLYLAGPLDEGLVCPFPQNTRLLAAIQIGDTIRIDLSDTEETMSDIQFSLASGCLSLTCMHFASCNEVIIVSGNRSANFNFENLVLFDAAPSSEAANGGTP